MMLKHLVVAVDFSPAWAQLRARLGQLRSWGTERLTLVHVLSTRYPAAPQEGHREHYQRELAEVAAELKAVGFEAEARVRAGEPAREVLAAAAEAQADAVLIGTRGHSVLRDLFLGSTSLELIRLSHLPVWLEPLAGDGPASGAGLLMLATDGSASAAGAEAAFRSLLPRAKRGLVITAAAEAVQHEPGDADAKAHLATFEGAETRVLGGHPADAISRTAREDDASLVVVGKRGRNPLQELVLGSTAEAVCRRATRPVLLVPSRPR